MWQRFTEHARMVVFRAQEESGRLGDNNVNDGHMLLGLLRVDDCGGLKVLAGLGVAPGAIREAVAKRLSSGSGRPKQDMELTPRGKRIIDLAYDEARSAGHNYIGSEHLILAMIREGEGPAGLALAEAGLELERARAEVLRLIGTGEIAHPNEPSYPLRGPDTNLPPSA